jgi:hypothetical protein
LPREPPFISKTLKLVSVAILLATVSIAVTAAYSGYEEYGALTSTVTGGSLNQLQLAINGSTLSISGLSVPNKMTFPLTLELLGTVSLNNATIGTFDSGTYLIQPDQSQSVNVSIPLSFAGLLKNSQALEAAAINSSLLSINTTVSAHMVPLLGINITKAANTTAGPILGDLSANLNSSGARLSSDGQTLDVPFILSWENTSPLATGSLWLSGNLTRIPGRSPGNYGTFSGPLNFTQGQNQEAFVLQTPVSDFNSGFPKGSYTFEISLSQSSTSSPFLQITKSVSV